MMMTRFSPFAFTLLLLAGSCGGLKYKISDALIADVPIAEKQAILAIQDEQTQLKQSREKARFELEVADRDLSVARAESKIARLGIDKVQADLDLAKATTDMNRIERAKARLAVAELGRRTAETKLAWRKLRVDYAAQRIRQLAATQGHAEARYEQEKARLAAQKGKTPYEKFSLTQFDLQVSEAQAKLDKERVEEDRLRQELAQIEARYQSEKQQLDAARSSAPNQAVPPSPPLTTAAPAPGGA